jgi:hypothetical protein
MMVIFFKIFSRLWTFIFFTSRAILPEVYLLRIIALRSSVREVMDNPLGLLIKPADYTGENMKVLLEKTKKPKNFEIFGFFVLAIKFIVSFANFS